MPRLESASCRGTLRLTPPRCGVRCSRGLAASVVAYFSCVVIMRRMGSCSSRIRLVLCRYCCTKCSFLSIEYLFLGELDVCPVIRWTVFFGLLPSSFMVLGRERPMGRGEVWRNSVLLLRVKKVVVVGVGRVTLDVRGYSPVVTVDAFPPRPLSSVLCRCGVGVRAVGVFCVSVICVWGGNVSGGKPG